MELTPKYFKGTLKTQENDNFINTQKIFNKVDDIKTNNTAKDFYGISYMNPTKNLTDRSTTQNDNNIMRGLKTVNGFVFNNSSEIHNFIEKNSDIKQEKNDSDKRPSLKIRNITNNKDNFFDSINSTRNHSLGNPEKNKPNNMFIINKNSGSQVEVNKKRNTVGLVGQTSPKYFDSPKMMTSSNNNLSGFKLEHRMSLQRNMTNSFNNGINISPVFSGVMQNQPTMPVNSKKNKSIFLKTNEENQFGDTNNPHKIYSNTFRSFEQRESNGDNKNEILEKIQNLESKFKRLQIGVFNSKSISESAYLPNKNLKNENKSNIIKSKSMSLDKKNPTMYSPQPTFRDNIGSDSLLRNYHSSNNKHNENSNHALRQETFGDSNNKVISPKSKNLDMLRKKVSFNIPSYFEDSDNVDNKKYQNSITISSHISPRNQNQLEQINLQVEKTTNKKETSDINYNSKSLRENSNSLHNYPVYSLQDDFKKMTLQNHITRQSLNPFSNNLDLKTKRTVNLETEISENNVTSVNDNNTFKRADTNFGQRSLKQEITNTLLQQPDRNRASQLVEFKDSVKISFNKKENKKKVSDTKSFFKLATNNIDQGFFKSSKFAQKKAKEEELPWNDTQYILYDKSKKKSGVMSNDGNIYPINFKFEMQGHTCGIFGVIIGHGTHGCYVAKSANDDLKKYFNVYVRNKSEYGDESLIKTQKNSIGYCKKKLLDEEYLNSYKNGISICYVLLFQQKIFCVNLGGSQAVVIQDTYSTITDDEKSESLMEDISNCSISSIDSKSQLEESTDNINNVDRKENNLKKGFTYKLESGDFSKVHNHNGLKKNLTRFTHIDLCKRHDTKNVEEIGRITNTGGQIEMELDQYGDPIGRMRILNPFSRNFYQYTRALGDFEAEKIGINNDPEITVLPIDKSMKFLILSTNYVWFNFEKPKLLKKIRVGLMNEDMKLINQTIFNEYKKKQVKIGEAKLMKKKERTAEMLDNIQFYIMSIALNGSHS